MLKKVVCLQVQYDEQLMQNSGRYQESSVQSPVSVPPQRQVVQHEDVQGFDDYDEEDFRRDISDTVNTHESHSNYHY